MFLGVVCVLLKSQNITSEEKRSGPVNLEPNRLEVLKRRLINPRVETKFDNGLFLMQGVASLGLLQQMKRI